MSKSGTPDVNPVNYEKLLFPSNKRLIYSFDITKRIHYEDVKNIIPKIGAKAIKRVVRGCIAIISDSQNAYFMETATKTQKVEKYNSLPQIFKDAIDLDIPVVTVPRFVNSYDKAKRLRSFPRNETRAVPNTTCNKATKSKLPTTTILIRGDDEFCPLLKKINLPMMHLGQSYGASLFHSITPELEQKRREELTKEKENGITYENASFGSFKEIVPKAERKREQAHCEICRETFSDIWLHYNSEEHKRFTKRPKFYKELDNVLKEFTKPFPNSAQLNSEISEGVVSLTSTNSMKETNNNECSPNMTCETISLTHTESHHNEIIENDPEIIELSSDGAC